MSLRQAHQQDQPEIDIIAVHGLDFVDTSGKCQVSSWREPSNDLEDGWLNAFIEKSRLKARLFFYEFDSVTTFGTSLERVSEEADRLLHQMSTARPSTDQHTPIIFLGHGLGGILIKQALMNASQNRHYAEIKSATRGLVFFGTPHQQQPENYSWVEGVPSLRSPYNPELLPMLNKNKFRDQIFDYQYISFYGNADQVVSYDSAVLGLPGSRETQVRLDSNHVNLCCFPIGSDNYKKVTRNLWQLCDLLTQQESQTA